MERLTRERLYSLEHYAQLRTEFRNRVLAHKKSRQVNIGPHARLYFEDMLTVHYQIQEMLRVERIFEADAIEEELATYNPLIPDGHNWKATFMLEYDDPDVRRQALAQLIGVEDRIWIQVRGNDRVYAIADEDLDRENESKTSAVHFVRFELDDRMIRDVKGDVTVIAGIDHPACRQEVVLPDAVRSALKADLA